MELRPYQEQIVEEARTLMRRGVKSLVIEAPTGSGKTVLAAFMLQTAVDKGMQALFVIHRREILDQASRTFSAISLPHSVIAAGYDSGRHPVKICSIASLIRRLKEAGKPHLIVWDECHHTAARSWARVREYFSSAYHIGLSATPERLDGQGLIQYFQQIIHGPSIRSLQASGHLAYYRLLAPPLISTDELQKRAGEFILTGTVEETLSKPAIIGDAIEQYKKHAAGKQLLIFSPTLKYSRGIAERYTANGIPCEHIDGETPDNERRDAVERFRTGKLQAITNVNLFGEGFDVPGVECVQMLRPTCSLGFYRQMIGRGLRPSPEKDVCVILDHVGNTARHGLPCEPIEWNLEGREKREGAPGVRICKVCFAAQAPGTSCCEYCGGVFAPEPPREIEELSGDLVEVTQAQKLAKKIEQKQARTLEALIAIGKARGYRRPRQWAEHVYRARQSKAGA